MAILGALRTIFHKKADPATADLYAACVAAARQPVFYASYGVSDNVDGRFDCLLLHVVLLMLRLKDPDARQNLFDWMFADMDRSLREMGVGDMSIGKKMKPMLAGFYGRGLAYQAALATGNDEALIAALSRNLYGKKEGLAEHAPAIALYVRATATHLAALQDDVLAAGHVSFPTIN